jgi:hypothetical protein
VKSLPQSEIGFAAGVRFSSTGDSETPASGVNLPAAGSLVVAHEMNSRTFEESMFGVKRKLNPTAVAPRAKRTVLQHATGIWREDMGTVVEIVRQHEILLLVVTRIEVALLE